jgi:hypothetical protein
MKSTSRMSSGGSHDGRSASERNVGCGETRTPSGRPQGRVASAPPGSSVGSLIVISLARRADCSHEPPAPRQRSIRNDERLPEHRADGAPR